MLLLLELCLYFLFIFISIIPKQHCAFLALQIMERFIFEALWGVPAKGKMADTDGKDGTVSRQSSLIDELLDGIVQSAASKYASEAGQKLVQILSTCAVRDTHQRRYTQAAVAGEGPLEPSVTTVPRGWLNSGKNVTRKRMHPSTLVDNHSDATLASLRRLDGAVPGGGFAAARGLPVPPTRQASLSVGPSEALRQALKGASKDDAWRQCHLGPQNVDAHTTGWGLGETLGFKSSYQVLYIN